MKILLGLVFLVTHIFLIELTNMHLLLHQVEQVDCYILRQATLAECTDT
jgi:hypothetical protein